MVTKEVPAGATAVGNPARLRQFGGCPAARRPGRENGLFCVRRRARPGRSLAQAIHGLLDHAAETDRRLAMLLKELEAAGVKCDEQVQPADQFDPKYLSKIVDQ